MFPSYADDNLKIKNELKQSKNEANDNYLKRQHIPLQLFSLFLLQKEA